MEFGGARQGRLIVLLVSLHPMSYCYPSNICDHAGCVYVFVHECMMYESWPYAYQGFRLSAGLRPQLVAIITVA
jgi:hypothetical protein